MDPTVVAALIGTAGAIAGSVVTGPVVAHFLGRRQRAAQAAQAASLAVAQTDQLKTQTDALRQDIYQQLTEDLKAELERVRLSLRTTSAEAEQLRTRVVDLESRVAHLTQSEARSLEALRETQAERDRLRVELAARDATIAELRGQVADLKLQAVAALVQPPAH